MQLSRSIRRVLLPVMAALLGIAGAVTLQPQEAVADEDHPYTTPGQREYNGRLWNTVCEKYSQTQRCRAEIWATQSQLVNGTYQFVEGWVFNNLTYLASDREMWKDNPLAKNGQFIRDGRMWQTSCFDEWTGDNGCRSFIYASVIEATQGASGWQFNKVDKWVFNNVVQFTPVKTTPTPPPTPVYDNPCNAPAPAGFAFTKDGRPHVIKTPYTPNTHYNPISLANFMRVSMRSTTLPDADKLCFALLGAEHLLKGAKERSYAPAGAEHEDSLWFPYPFEFDANNPGGHAPGEDPIPPLQPGWYSGLGQVGAMTAFLELYKVTGDSHWEDIASKIFNSYLIPLEDGGFTNRNNGFLWFEEYPSTPPTVVLNGHFENVIGLHDWAKYSQDPVAWDLFDEAIADTKTQIEKAEVPLSGGIMTSYDLVRGFPATPIRAVAKSDDTRINETLLNGERIQQIPLGTRSSPSPSLLKNPWMDNVSNGVPQHWRAVNGNTAGVRIANGMVGARPNGKAWAGVEQTIPAGSFPSGALMTLNMDSKLEIPEGQAGTGGKVSVYAECPTSHGKTTTLIHENARNRSREVSWSSSAFTAPSNNCDIKVQLLTFSYTVTNTTAWYDNVVVRVADPLGAHLVPDYDLEVHKTWTNKITIRGAGEVDLLVYDGGRWLRLSGGNISGSGLEVTIPERYTGRNINYNYHDGHILELQLLACQSLDRFFDDKARSWSRMAANHAYSSTRFANCQKDAAQSLAVPRVLTELGGEPTVVQPEPEPMTDAPVAVPTTMSLPTDDE